MRRLERALGAGRWSGAARQLRRRFHEDRLGITAGSLTFTTLIALVPLVTVMLAVFTAFPIFSTFQSALEKYFLQTLVPNSIAGPVLRTLTQFASNASRLGAVGLLLLLGTALALMLTIDRTLNAIWRVPKPRPIAQRVLVYWAALTLGPLVLGISLSVTSYALTASRGLAGVMPGGLRLLLNGLQFTLLATAAAGLFHYVPNTAVRWRHAWAGAIFVAVGFELAKRGLAWYVDTVPTYSAVYGAFATAPILLLWIYLGWLIVLSGAVIAAGAPSLSPARALRAPHGPGAAFELALAALRALHAARATAAHGVSQATLAQVLDADVQDLQPLLDLLCRLGWVVRLDEAHSPRHLLLCHPGATNAAPLIDALLLPRSRGSAEFRARAGFDAITVAALLGIDGNSDEPA